MADGASQQESESTLLTIQSENNLIAGEYAVGVILSYFDDSDASALATRSCFVNLTIIEKEAPIVVQDIISDEQNVTKPEFVLTDNVVQEQDA